MKPMCGSCAFFKSHKPVTPGAGGNSECLRTPGYYRSGVMDACEFYAKKGKKVAKKKIPLCTNCDAPFGKDGAYSLPNLEGKVCFKCYEKLCSNPLYLVSNKDKRCGRCDGPLGDHTKAVEGYSRLLCDKCGEETAEEYFICVNCECHTQGKAHYVKGGEKPLCVECYEYLTTGKPSDKKTESFTCSECGETDHVTAHKVPGIEGFVCYRCLERLKKDRPVVMSVANVEDVKAKDCCYTCGKHTKPGNRRLLPNSEGFICRTCATKSKLNLPNAPVPKEEKKVKALCSTCGKYDDKGLTDSEGNFVCASCAVWLKERAVTETPIYERYVVVRSFLYLTEVYTHMQFFRDWEEVRRYIRQNNRPTATFKVLRVSSNASITLEDKNIEFEPVVSFTTKVQDPKCL
jgi:hypothetical protein